MVDVFEKILALTVRKENKMSKLTTLLFSPTGRLNRLPYIFTPIFIALALLLIDFLMKLTIGSSDLNIIFYGISIIIYIMLTIKRWHDVDKSGWLTVLSFIPIVNFFTALFLWFAKGTNGKNQYGDNPLA